jgi:iduronate 2-sulfatase
MLNHLSGRRPDTTKVWNFQTSFRDALGSGVSSLPGAFKNNGYVSIGMGKVYHPGHPKADDGALSWSLDKFPYFHPSGYANKISNASDSTFQDGMTTDVAVRTLNSLHDMAGSNNTSHSLPTVPR